MPVSYVRRERGGKEREDFRGRLVTLPEEFGESLWVLFPAF
jgi:hypothetical protein